MLQAAEVFWNDQSISSMNPRSLMGHNLSQRARAFWNATRSRGPSDAEAPPCMRNTCVCHGSSKVSLLFYI